jgi:hypothetical protein
MKLVIKCYKNGNLAFENDFNHSSFYEVPFVQIGLKLNLIDVPEGYYANNLAGLKLRRNFKATKEQKEIILSSLELTKEQKYLLGIAYNKNQTIDGKSKVEELISIFSGFKIGNLEDINSWFDENNMNNIDKIIFEEKED